MMRVWTSRELRFQPVTVWWAAAKAAFSSLCCEAVVATARTSAHPSCWDVPVFLWWKANMLVEQPAKCCIRFRSVLCKYGSLSQRRRSLSYAGVSGRLCSNDWACLLWGNQLGAASWMEIRSRLIYFSPSLHRQCTRTNLTSWCCIVKRWGGRTTRPPWPTWTALSSKYRTHTCCCHFMGKKIRNIIVFSCYNTIVCYIVKTGSFYGKKISILL